MLILRAARSVVGHGTVDPMNLADELAPLDRAEGVVSVEPLSGGNIATAWRVDYQDGSSVVAKTLPGGAEDLFSVEAAGLDALGVTGCIRTPEVLAVTDRLLLLEAMLPRRDDPEFWETLASDLAALHRSTTADRFGWYQDGYLGQLPQRNAWATDGHAFYAEHRLLRYVSEPLVDRALSPADCRALERLCDRLPEIIPTMPPVLTHGDLWSQNLLTTADGHPALVDPAVSYTWAEVDLSMLWCEPRPPDSDRFFAVYQDLAPSPPGWVERMPVLFLRELLSCLAHFGDTGSYGDRVRTILAPFRQRR